MADVLLAAKLTTPPPRSGLVPRPYLIARLNAGLAGKVTVLSAPPGYGKTTLLAQWLGSVDRVSAWLSLDERDNDPARFLAYLLASMDRVEATAFHDAEGLLGGPQPPQVEVVVAALLAGLDRAGRPLVLALDDYQTIVAPQIHQAVRLLVERSSPALHVVVATRADPPLPLALWRARGDLTEIHAANLGFDARETAVFLRSALEHPLSPAEVSRLYECTEGWVAGLQLAALAMRDRSMKLDFTASFSGNHPYVVDFLAGEVLDRQTESVRDFLLRTSILDQLAAPLCDAVVGRTDSQAMLARLEHDNLFLIPLDERRVWYRYHRLFVDLLRRRLLEGQPGEEVELHRRASHWYARNALPAEAIDHAIAAADHAEAARLIEHNAGAMLRRGETATLSRLIESLPAELLDSTPSLAIYRAWGRLYAGGPPEEIAACLRRLGTDAEQGDVADEAAVLRALIAVVRGDAEGARTLSAQAISRLPAENTFLRSLATSGLGMARTLQGDIEGAAAAFGESAALSRQAGSISFAVSALCNVAGLSVVRGEFRRAESLYRQALAGATAADGTRLPTAARALLGLGEVSRERNDLVSAAALIEEALILSQRYGQVGEIAAYLHLARVKQAMGDSSAALDLVTRARGLAEQPETTKLDDRLVALTEARLWIDGGNLEAASRWAHARGFEPAGDPPDMTIMSRDLDLAEQVLYARLCLARRRPDAALRVLDPLVSDLERQKRQRQLVEVAALQALALKGRGEMERALRSLRRALSIAAPEGYARIFLDLGKPMAALLYEAAKRNVEASYVGRILAAFANEGASRPAGTATPSAKVIETLSAREIEVLGLLAAGLSNADIARRLVVSLSTVKGHTARIYAKLAVNSRTRAVAEARTLGIIRGP